MQEGEIPCEEIAAQLKQVLSQLIDLLLKQDIASKRIYQINKQILSLTQLIPDLASHITEQLLRQMNPENSYPIIFKDLLPIIKSQAKQNNNDSKLTLAKLLFVGIGNKDHDEAINLCMEMCNNARQVNDRKMLNIVIWLLAEFASSYIEGTFYNHHIEKSLYKSYLLSRYVNRAAEVLNEEYWDELNDPIYLSKLMTEIIQAEDYETAYLLWKENAAIPEYDSRDSYTRIMPSYLSMQFQFCLLNCDIIDNPKLSPFLTLKLAQQCIEKKQYETGLTLLMMIDHPVSSNYKNNYTQTCYDLAIKMMELKSFNNCLLLLSRITPGSPEFKKAQNVLQFGNPDYMANTHYKLKLTKKEKIELKLQQYNTTLEKIEKEMEMFRIDINSDEAQKVDENGTSLSALRDGLILHIKNSATQLRLISGEKTIKNCWSSEAALPKIPKDLKSEIHNFSTNKLRGHRLWFLNSENNKWQRTNENQNCDQHEPGSKGKSLI